MNAERRWPAATISAIVLAIAILASAALVSWLRRPPPETAGRIVQFDIAPPPGALFAPTISRQSFAISPDGRRLAFSATTSGGTNLWIRDLASPEMHVVPGTDGVWSIFWSPDSRRLYFSVRNTLKEVNPDTGSARTVAELPDIPQTGMWRRNGDLVLYLGAGSIHELHLEDGSLREGPGFGELRWPQLLPGTDRMIYSLYEPASGHSRAVVTDYTAPTPVLLMQTDSRVQYAPPLRAGEPGYLVFIRGGSLLAQPFDAQRLHLTGEPFPMAQNVIYYGPTLSASFSVSDNGILVYQANFPLSELKWYDRSGKEVGEAGRPARHWGNVRVSRDGRRVAAAIWSQENGATSIWSFDSNGRDSRRVTFPPDVHRRPVWSPNGLRLAVGRSASVGGPRLSVLDLPD